MIYELKRMQIVVKNPKFVKQVKVVIILKA